MKRYASTAYIACAAFVWPLPSTGHSQHKSSADRQKTSHGIGLEVLITAAAAADTILRYYIINHYPVCRNPTWRLVYSLNCRISDVFWFIIRADIIINFDKSSDNFHFKFSLTFIYVDDVVIFSQRPKLLLVTRFRRFSK